MDSEYQKAGKAELPPRAAGPVSRFDYVKYDDRAVEQQNEAKALFTKVEAFVDGLDPGRAKSTVYTKLEEAYMWIGKAVRDEQIARNGSAPLQEVRKDG